MNKYKNYPWGDMEKKDMGLNGGEIKINAEWDIN